MNNALMKSGANISIHSFKIFATKMARILKNLAMMLIISPHIYGNGFPSIWMTLNSYATKGFILAPSIPPKD